MKAVVAAFNQEKALVGGLLRDCENRLWNRWRTTQHYSQGWRRPSDDEEAEEVNKYDSTIEALQFQQQFMVPYQNFTWAMRECIKDVERKASELNKIGRAHV